jgi:nucleoid-associated protein YgaU
MPVRAANSQTPRALVQAKSNVTQTNALATKPQAESLPRFVVALPAVYNQEAPKHTAAVEESDVLVDRRAALPLADVVAAVEEISVPANVHALAWSSGADVARSQLTAFALAPEQQLQLIEAAATIDESIADVSLEVGQTLLMPLQQGPEPPQPIAVPVTQPQPQPATQQPATGTPQGQRYVVRRNDTLRTIAREFYKDERRWRAIYDANREVIGRNPDLIYPNQRLIIPSAAPIGGKPNPSQPSQGQRTYVVRSGDTLSTIALRYYGNGNLWPLVYEANRRTIGGNPDVIRPQQQLTIPQRTSGQPQPQPQPGKRTYTVKRGDSLREIAQQFYGNELRWQEIYRANRQLIPDPDRLRIGIQLAIP